MAFTLDELFKSMEQIVDSKVSGLEFDKTIVCKVVDDSEASNGKYMVTDESITFEAYSDNTSYSAGNQVYVVIPKSDWSSKKMIAGLYSTAVSTANYVSNKDRLMVLEEIIAKNTVEEPDKWMASLDTPYNTSLCNCICISMDIEAYPKDEAYVPTLEVDNYGFAVIFYDNNGKAISMPSFSAEDMIGNPFYYYSPTKQETIYQLSSEVMANIKKVQLLLFQDSENIELNIQNIEVTSGFDTFNYVNNQVFVYPVSHSGKYKGAIDNITTNEENEIIIGPLTAEVQAIWINKDKDGKYLGFINLDKENLDKDKATGETPLDLTKKEDGTGGTDIGKTYYWIEWLADRGYADLLLDEDIDEISKTYSLELLRGQSKTQVQARVWINGESYDSEPYAFINEERKTDLIASENIELHIENIDANDVYRYNENNSITEVTPRQVRFNWTSYNKLEDDIWNGATVEWKIPKQKTLLKPVLAEDQLKSNGEDIEDDNFYIYRYTIDDSDFETNILGELKLKESGYSYYYNLASTFTSSAINNIIYCKVSLPKYQGSANARKNLIFDTKALQGTDYVFMITSIEPEQYFTGVNELKKFSSSLIDVNGKEVSNYSVKWYIGNTHVGETDSSNQNQIELELQNPLDYNVIKAETEADWAGSQTQLIATYPAAFSSQGDYVADTVTHINYDNSGNLQNPSLRPLRLYKLPSSESGQIEMVQNCKWKLKTDGDYDFAPQVQSKNNEYFIIPPPFYAEGEIKSHSVLYATNSNGVVLWSNPIIIEQNLFDNKLLNNWNSELKIDKEGNYVLTRAMGVGVKHNDNSFSGVFLGDIKSHATDNSSMKIETGLMGYNRGEPAFGFRDDGTAFIGKSGQGRILFEGDKGIIASQSYINSNGNLNNYEQVESGMLIDLKNGSLEIKNKTGSYFLFKDDKIKLQCDRLQLMAGDGNIVNLLSYTNPILIDNTVNEEAVSNNHPFALYWGKGNAWSGTTYIVRAPDIYREKKYNGIKIKFNIDKQRGNTIFQKFRVSPGKDYMVSGRYKGSLQIRLIKNNSWTFVEGIGGKFGYSPEFTDFKLKIPSSLLTDNQYRLAFTYADNLLEEEREVILTELQFEENNTDTPSPYGEAELNVSSRFIMTENMITTSVGNLNENYWGTVSQVQQTRDSISSGVFGVDKPNYNYTYYGDGAPPSNNPYELTASDVGIMYLDYSSGQPYYWIGSSWIKTDSEGNKLKRESIKGYSSLVQKVNSITAEVFDGGDGEGFGWQLNSDNFILYSKKVNKTSTSTSNKKVFVCNESGILVGNIKSSNNQPDTSKTYLQYTTDNGLIISGTIRNENKTNSSIIEINSDSIIMYRDTSPIFRLERNDSQPSNKGVILSIGEIMLQGFQQGGSVLNFGSTGKLAALDYHGRVSKSLQLYWISNGYDSESGREKYILGGYA